MVKVVDLYDLEAGVVLSRAAVTAHEAVAIAPGRYTLDRPAVWPPAKKSASVEAAKGGSVVTSPAQPPAPAPAGDTLTAIKGIGPGFARRLADAGLGTFAAIAASTPEALAQIINMPGKSAVDIAEERWIEQAAERVSSAA